MTSTPAMIPLVLELETQAAAMADGAKAEAERILSEAASARGAARGAADAEIAARLERHRDDARRIMENDVNKLRSLHAQELETVRQISPETMAKGVSLVMARLKGVGA